MSILTFYFPVSIILREEAFNTLLQPVFLYLGLNEMSPRRCTLQSFLSGRPLYVGGLYFGFLSFTLPFTSNISTVSLPIAMCLKYLNIFMLILLLYPLSTFRSSWLGLLVLCSVQGLRSILRYNTSPVN